MNKEDRKFLRTIEDLVAFIEERHGMADTRWSLIDAGNVVDGYKWWLTYDRGNIWGRWRNNVYLSDELAAQLDGLWKHRPAYKGSSWMVRSGTMTIGGMLKRLGREAEYKARVTAAMDRANKLTGIRRRNSSRREVQRLAGELMIAMQRGSELGCEWPDTVAELANLSATMEDDSM